MQHLPPVAGATLSLITAEGVHLWDPMNPFTQGRIMGQLPDGALQDYASLDEAVNRLHALGFKASARELNADKPVYIMKSQHQNPQAASFALYNGAFEELRRVVMPLADAKAYAEKHGLKAISPADLIRGRK